MDAGTSVEDLTFKPRKQQTEKKGTWKKNEYRNRSQQRNFRCRRRRINCQNQPAKQKRSTLD